MQIVENLAAFDTRTYHKPVLALGNFDGVHLGIHEVVVGHDFRFEYERAGTVDFLQAQAEPFGYQVTVIPAIRQDDTVVSSSNIRRLLLAGHVEQAARLLGRYYAIEGPVVEG